MRISAVLNGLLFFLAVLPALAASPEVELQALKERYLRLRNTDVSVSKKAEWKELARLFEEYADRYPDSPKSASALFNASILYGELALHGGGMAQVENAEHMLERVSVEYPLSELADDALIRRGDILRAGKSDEDSARKLYQEVLKSYPESDMAEVARARLREKAPAALSEKPTASVKPRAGQPVVLIDPGHGGEDYGAAGQGGLLEKDVTLAVAYELQSLLESELKAVVRLSRRADLFVPLAERTNLANDFDADIFISLHTNASPNGKASGIETYYLDTTGDKASQLLAERENKSAADGERIDDLGFMLSDLIQNAKLQDSIRLARSIQKSSVGWLRHRWQAGKSLGVKKAPFYVLVGAHMPCVLIEMGFIDHAVDGANLANREFRKDLAYGIFLGIKNFLQL